MPNRLRNNALYAYSFKVFTESNLSFSTVKAITILKNYIKLNFFQKTLDWKTQILLNTIIQYSTVLETINTLLLPCCQ
jgi:hypothetical protein